MRLVSSITAFFRADVPVRDLDRARSAGIDAYDLLDSLPRGPARLAAWNAYVLQIYGDKLIAASEAAGHVRRDTADVALRLYQRVGPLLAKAQQTSAVDQPTQSPLPHWHTPVRSPGELAGMRDTLDALRTYVAFDLESLADADSSVAALRARLAAIDAERARADSLWVRHPPDELRGGIGDALASGLNMTYELGQLLAQPDLDPERLA